MPKNDETRDDASRAVEQQRRPRAGVVAIMMAGEPSCVSLEVPVIGLEIGRGTPAGWLEADDRVSRRHVRIRRSRGEWLLSDLESRNGTFVGGQPLTGELAFKGDVLIRVGRSLFWAVEDLTPFRQLEKPPRVEPGLVLGGRLRAAWDEIALASRSGSTMYVRGESGSGKELAARAFHAARFPDNAKAPFVAVNCAAIPEGLAERLLFGAQRGAFSGANADAEGYAQAAHKGTLFLDEIAELDPLVQAKLLRVLEMREVLPLGATRPRAVDIAVCVASHKNLRDEVARGRFREDLYFRLGRPEVQLPPLRERLDELPWLIACELGNVDQGLSAAVTFVEACALRAWPGNVRELLHEVRRAAHRALHEQVSLVEPRHLSNEAGLVIVDSAPEQSAQRRAVAVPSDDVIERVLDENGGNVRGTARALGMHRNQLRRWLERRAGGIETTE
jgi:transcriptional regulator of acetoin/glycerol metabolism